MEHKNVSFEIKNINPESGEFAGYASVFDNVDSDMDIMAKGAFTNTIANRFANNNKPKMLWQHNPEMIIGVWDEMAEDDRGLFVKGRLLVDVAKGREALALMREGALDGMSVGFMTEEAVDEGSNGSVRRIVKVDLWEVSLVTWGANAAARVTDVKTLKTERDYERFLRDAGYSRKDAKALTSHGFKALDAQWDAVDEKAKDDKAMNALFNSLKQQQETFNV